MLRAFHTFWDFSKKEKMLCSGEHTQALESFRNILELRATRYQGTSEQHAEWGRERERERNREKLNLCVRSGIVQLAD